MTCHDVREAFSDLYEGTLSGPPLLALSQHLEECAECRVEWADFSMTMHVVTGLGGEEPSLGFAARVRQHAEGPPGWKRAAQWLFVPPRRKVPLHAAALVLLALAAVLLSQRSPQLRRETQVRVAQPAPVVPQAPPAAPPAPVPPAMDKTAPGKAASAPPPAVQKAERPEGRTGASGLAAPTAQPRAKAEQETAPSSPRPAVKESKQPIGTSEKPEKAPGPTPLLEAKRSEPGAADMKTQPSVPKAAESRDVPASAPPAKPTPSAAPPAGSADELFSGAATEYARQGYGPAIEGFRAFLTGYPQDRRMADARFFLADAYFAQKRYAEAAHEYETFLREYPDNRRAPIALYRQGQARLAMGDKGGCQLLRDAISRSPKSHEAASAREALSARCP